MRVVALGALAVLLGSALMSATSSAGETLYGTAAQASSRSAILWTRSDAAGPVSCDVATDRSFKHIVTDSCGGTADEATDLTVKSTVTGLKPSTRYFYRFGPADLMGFPLQGTFKTLPVKSTATPLELSFTGDSDILWNTPPEGDTQPPFAVLDRIREEHPNMFVYMGDTIYSDSETNAPTALTFDEKAQKYKDNRIAATQRLLRSTSTWAIWDDHEVINDFDGAQLAQDDPALLTAGRDAFNAYWPVHEKRYYRKVPFGKNADMFFLDERTYRTQSADEADSPCRDKNGTLDKAPTMPDSDRAQLGYPPADPVCVAHVNDLSRTMLGATQLQWLENALLKSKAKWKLIMNEVVISQLFVIPYDRWDGYSAERTALLQFIADHHIKNVVFLTTDIHANFASRVYVDITAEGSKPVAYEFATGPIQTCTLKCEIEALTTQGAGELFKNFLISNHLIDVDCVNFDSFGYDDLSIPATGSALTSTFKTDEPARGGGGKLMTDVSGNSPKTCKPITLKSGAFTPSR